MRFPGAYPAAADASDGSSVYDGLRITSGSDAAIDRRLEALGEVLAEDAGISG
jgi:hypothetical protein